MKMSLLWLTAECCRETNIQVILVYHYLMCIYTLLLCDDRAHGHILRSYHSTTFINYFIWRVCLCLFFVLLWKRWFMLCSLLSVQSCGKWWCHTDQLISRPALAEQTRRRILGKELHYWYRLLKVPVENLGRVFWVKALWSTMWNINQVLPTEHKWSLTCTAGTGTKL